MLPSDLEEHHPTVRTPSVHQTKASLFKGPDLFIPKIPEISFWGAENKWESMISS